MVAALNLMLFVIIMVVLGVGILIVIVGLKEEGIFPFRCQDESADKARLTFKTT